MVAPVCSFFYPTSQNLNFIFIKRIMFIGHPVFRILETDAPDHFTVFRISRNDGMFSGFDFGKRFIAEQETESAFLPTPP